MWGGIGRLITYKTSSPLNPPLTTWGELSLLMWYCCCLKFDLNNGMSSRNICLFITSLHKSLRIKEELRRKSGISAGAHRVNCGGECWVHDDLQLIRWEKNRAAGRGGEMPGLWGTWEPKTPLYQTQVLPGPSAYSRVLSMDTPILETGKLRPGDDHGNCQQEVSMAKNLWAKPRTLNDQWLSSQFMCKVKRTT